MAEAAFSIQQPHERASGLHALGLDESTVTLIVHRGLAARRTCTPFDPPSYPGLVQWATCHRAARELLSPRGWTPDDRRNYSRVVHPERTVALTVATGDENTGNPTAEPRTRYSKGPATRTAVQINGQLSLWPAQPQEPGALDVEGSQQATWVLLQAIIEDELRYELSRPANLDESQYITAWSQRIIFEPVELDAIMPREDDGDDDDGLAGPDVSVEPI